MSWVTQWLHSIQPNAAPQPMRPTPGPLPVNTGNLQPHPDSNQAVGLNLVAPLFYLIGTDKPGSGKPGAITHVSYRARPVKDGISSAYCNLFDEENTGAYAPYLHTSDTAAEYNEGQIDPKGPGWIKNLREQFERRRAEGFRYLELDNPDAYDIAAILNACDLAAAYGFKIFAKNPGLLDKEANQLRYVRHPAIVGIIVERGAGSPDDMAALRIAAGKPNLPVWFVYFDKGISSVGEHAARVCAQAAKPYKAMWTTYSAGGEYTRAELIT